MGGLGGPPRGARRGPRGEPRARWRVAGVWIFNGKASARPDPCWMERASPGSARGALRKGRVRARARGKRHLAAFPRLNQVPPQHKERDVPTRDDDILEALT